MLFLRSRGHCRVTFIILLVPSCEWEQGGRDKSKVELQSGICCLFSTPMGPANGLSPNFFLLDFIQGLFSWPEDWVPLL